MSKCSKPDWMSETEFRRVFNLGTDLAVSAVAAQMFPGVVVPNPAFKPSDFGFPAGQSARYYVDALVERNRPPISVEEIEAELQLLRDHADAIGEIVRDSSVGSYPLRPNEHEVDRLEAEADERDAAKECDR